MIPLVAAAFACGPDFPPYLLALDPKESLEPMVGDFDQLITPLIPDTKLPEAVSWRWEEMERADAEAGLPRTLVEPWMAARAAARERRTYTAPSGLPEEYRLYLEGSAAFHRDRCADTSAFNQLLELPAEQRRNRTTWAEYMLGFCAVGADRAPAWARLRSDAAAGFADRWGLAASSYGEEALDHPGEPLAWTLYLAQAATEHSGASSLLMLARDALDHPETLPTLAADPTVSAVISAYVASRDSLPVAGDPDARPLDEDDARRATWLRYARAPVVGAGTLAWLSYQDAHYDEAARWADKAARDDGWAAWVRGRLALRDGRLEDARLALADASARLPKDSWETLFRFRGWGFTPDGEARAEAAAAQQAQGRYVEALEGFLPTRYWIDAAYVAERVLTLEELQAFVDAKVPAPTAVPPDASDYPGHVGATEFWGCGGPCDSAIVAERLRWLLARRLVRAGRVDEAVRYAPAHELARFEGLRDALARGATIDAARRMRVDGLEVAGTELDPDYTAFAGNYELSIGPDRMARTDPLGPGAEERARYAASAPDPDQRYHYRFVAARRLVDFARALPDDDPRVAWSMCTAGRWVYTRDGEMSSQWYHEALRRDIDRSGVRVWFGDCGEEPTAPKWWWRWRKPFSQVPHVGVGIGALVWWGRRRKAS